MRNLIAIVVVALCFVSVGFGQAPKKVEEKIDTARFIQILESEFNFQVNEYRKSKGLDTMPTNEYLKDMCIANNERLANIPEFFTKWRLNSEYRVIAHEGFDKRIEKLYHAPRPRLDQSVSEIVHDRKVTLTNDSNEIKKIAKVVQEGFAGSKDHNEALLEKYGFGIYTSFKVVSIDSKDYIVITSIISNYDK